MIPIVMEPEMKDINTSWLGSLKLILGGILYVDYTIDNEYELIVNKITKEILLEHLLRI